MVHFMFDIRNYLGSSLSFIMSLWLDPHCRYMILIILLWFDKLHYISYSYFFPCHLLWVYGWIFIFVIWFSLSYYDPTNCIMVHISIDKICSYFKLHYNKFEWMSISEYTAWIVSALHCSIQINLVLMTLKFTTYYYPFHAWSSHIFFRLFGRQSITTICWSRLIYILHSYILWHLF